MVVVGEIEDPDGNIWKAHLEEVDYKERISEVVLLIKRVGQVRGEGGAGERDKVGQVRGKGGAGERRGWSR